MADNTTRNNEALSLNLCDILNDMGYADKDVQYRIHIYELYEFLMNVPRVDLRRQKAVGSKITGLSTLIEGDVDWMFCTEKLLITENPPIDLPKDSFVLLTEHTNCPPGFCKLRFHTYNESIPIFERLFVHMENFCFLPNRKAYLSSKNVKSRIYEVYAATDPYLGRKSISGSGPAITRTDQPIRLNTDYVYSIPSRNLPKSMKKRFSRNRHWPTKSMVSDIAKAGCEVVPVGFPGSEEEHLQWRLSFSTAEKMLMQSLNSTQRKTYVLFKIYFKECLKSFIEAKVLSSYIAKMLILWMCEKRPQELWKDNLLIERFLDGLKWLKQCVEANNFPHYFIRERNMLACEMTSNDKSRLNTFLSDCIDSVLSCLLDCPSLRNKCPTSFLLKCGLTQGSSEIVASNDIPEKYLLYLVILNEINIGSRFCTISNATLDAHTKSAFERDILQYMFNEQSIREKCDGMSRVLEIRPDLWQVLAIAFNILRLRDNPNIKSVSGQVKLAMMHSAMRDNNFTYSVLQRLITRVESEQRVWILMNDRAKYTRDELWKGLDDLEMSLVLTNCCLCDIVFTGENLPLLPKGLRYNLCSFSEISIPYKVSITIDCMALAYYLQTLVCEQLGKQEEANEALAKLLLGSVGKGIKPCLNFEFRETTLNVAGHVYMERRDYRSAFTAIKKSVFFGKKVKASVDPSFLHLAVLLNKAFKARITR